MNAVLADYKHLDELDKNSPIGVIKPTNNIFEPLNSQKPEKPMG
jgi:hypothetical protein